MKFLGRYSDIAYALMRMVLAFLFMSHGYQRVFAGPILPPIPAASASRTCSK